MLPPFRPTESVTLLHRFITNAFWNIGGKIFVQLIYFFISIMISRYLGREGLGLYASILVVPAFVRLLNTLGLEGMLNKKLPELQVHDPTGAEGRFLIQRAVFLRFVSSLVSGALLYFLLPAYAAWANVPEIVYYRPAILCYFFAVTSTSMFGTLFMTWLRFRVVTVAESVNAVFNIFLLAVFILFDMGIAGVLSAYILSTLAQLILYWMMARPQLEGTVRPTAMEEARKLAWTVYGINLMSIGLWTQSDVILMNYFEVSKTGVGYYHLATSLGGMLVFALMGMGQLAQSLYSEVYAKEGEEGLGRIWKMTVTFCAWVTLPAGVFAFAFAPELVTWLFGAEFAPVATVFRIYAVYLVTAAVLGSDLNNFALFVLHKRKTALLISFEGSVWNLILDILWIPQYGEKGAALATGSVMVYMVLRQLFALGGVARLLPVLKNLLILFFCALVALAPGMLVPTGAGNVLILQLVAYGVTFVLITRILKPLPPEVMDLAGTQKSPALRRFLGWFVKPGGGPDR